MCVCVVSLSLCPSFPTLLSTQLTVTSRHARASATPYAASSRAHPMPRCRKGGKTDTWHTRRRVAVGQPYIRNSVANPAKAMAPPFNGCTASSMSQSGSSASMGEAPSMKKVSWEDRRACSDRTAGGAVAKATQWMAMSPVLPTPVATGVPRDAGSRGGAAATAASNAVCSENAPSSALTTAPTTSAASGARAVQAACTRVWPVTRWMVMVMARPGVGWGWRREVDAIARQSVEKKKKRRISLSWLRRFYPSSPSYPPTRSSSNTWCVNRGRASTGGASPPT